MLADVGFFYQAVYSANTSLPISTQPNVFTCIQFLVTAFYEIQLLQFWDRKVSFKISPNISLFNWNYFVALSYAALPNLLFITPDVVLALAYYSFIHYSSQILVLTVVLNCLNIIQINWIYMCRLWYVQNSGVLFLKYCKEKFVKSTTLPHLHTFFIKHMYAQLYGTDVNNSHTDPTKLLFSCITMLI